MSFSASSAVLLKGGVLLTHSSDEPPRVVPLVNYDVLITDGLIAKIDKEIAVTDRHVKVIDCTNKIISPGFVNTHAHLWQSQLKGRLSEVTLLSYFPRGGWVSYAYTAEDMYIGQLAGCLEAMDGGTTTVLDHAHGCYTTEHIQKAVDATVDSGIRCTWAYSEPTRLQKWDEDECSPSYDYWNSKTAAFIADLAGKLNSPDLRVQMGVAFDLWFLPKEMITPLFKQLTAAGVKTLTSHIGRNAVQGLHYPVVGLEQNHDLLSKDQSYLDFENFVVSHGTGLTEDDLKLLKRVREAGLNASISCTPTSEAPMCFHDSHVFSPSFTAPAHNAMCSLGVDCHAAGTSYMPSIATLAVNVARITSNTDYLARGQYPDKMLGSLSEAFNMITVYGARALGLDQAGGIGRLEVGRKADVTVIDTSQPGIGIAVEHSPLDALLAFSNSGNVEHVFVDGVQVKENFNLLPFRYLGGKKDWSEFRLMLLKSYEALETRIKKLSIEKATETLEQLYHIDKSRLVPGAV